MHIIVISFPMLAILGDFCRTLLKLHPLAKINAELNANRADARELMNIGLSKFKNLPEHPEFY